MLHAKKPESPRSFEPDEHEEPSALEAEPALRPRPVVPVAPALRDLVPYEAVSSQSAISARPSEESIFKLDWNESTVAPSPRVVETLSRYLLSGERGLNWYPVLGSRNLLEALEDYTHLPKDYLLATNGSDDALHLICSSYLAPEDEVVVPVPTYNHFVVFAESRGANIIRVQGDSPFDRNLEGIREAMSPSTRLLYLVSPNNPTGVLFPPEDVAALCDDFPHCLIVLDEAYFEFAQVSGMHLLQTYTNLIVTRTFSKAFGLAGLRVGYLAASPSIVNGLSKIYNPKSVNTLGQLGAMAALDDLPYLERFLQEVELSKEILGDFFTARGVEHFVTPANFILLRVQNIKRTLQQLEERGIYVRDRSSYPGLEDCLRMTVGTREQTRRLIERLDEEPLVLL